MNPKYTPTNPGSKEGEGNNPNAIDRRTFMVRFGLLVAGALTGEKIIEAAAHARLDQDKMLDLKVSSEVTNLSDHRELLELFNEIERNPAKVFDLQLKLQEKKIRGLLKMPNEPAPPEYKGETMALTMRLNDAQANLITQMLERPALQNLKGKVDPHVVGFRFNSAGEVEYYLDPQQPLSAQDQLQLSKIVNEAGTFTDLNMEIKTEKITAALPSIDPSKPEQFPLQITLFDVLDNLRGRGKLGGVPFPEDERNKAALLNRNVAVNRNEQNQAVMTEEYSFIDSTYNAAYFKLTRVMKFEAANTSIPKSTEFTLSFADTLAPPHNRTINYASVGIDNQDLESKQTLDSLAIKIQQYYQSVTYYGGK